MTIASQPPGNSLSDTQSLIQSFVSSCKQRGLSYQTIKWYRSFLRGFAEQNPELPVRPEPLEAHIGSYTSSDERRHGCYRTLKCFYRYLDTRFESFDNPIKRIRAPLRKRKEQPYLNQEQLKRLLEYPLHEPRIRILLYFLAATGARLGEAARLNRDGIYEEGEGFTVKLVGKTGARILPLDSDVKDMLLSLPGKKFFPGSVRWLGDHIREAFKNAGLQGNSGMLRHTFCSLWDGDIVSLRLITGHTSVAMIENYRHNKLGHAMKQYQEHSPIALLYGNKGNGQEPGGHIPEASLQVIRELAEELGAAKERIKHLETMLGAKHET